MAFNISRFKANLDRFGGPSRANLFEVMIIGAPVTGTSINAENVSFFCQTAVIPSISVTATPYEAAGEMPIAFPTGVTTQPFNAIFMMDSDHQVLQFFHRWIQQVVNYGTKGGPFSEVDGKLPFEIGYKKQYSCRIVIRHYSTESSPGKFYEVILDNAYPVSIGDVDLAWEQNDSYLTLPVSFSYDRIEYSGEKAGSSGDIGRGNGFFDILGRVAGFAGVVQQTISAGRPDSIQDAINRVTRLQSSLGRLNDVFPPDNDS